MCREFSVCSLSAIATASRNNSAVEPGNEMDVDNIDDSVYELTAADIQRELAAQKQRHLYNDAGFRTRARCALPCILGKLCRR